VQTEGFSTSSRERSSSQPGVVDAGLPVSAGEEAFLHDGIADAVGVDEGGGLAEDCVRLGDRVVRKHGDALEDGVEVGGDGSN